MDKGIILFDIDKTIFDTDKMVKAFDGKMMSILGVSDFDYLKQAKEEYKKSLANERYFVPERFCETLCERFNFDNQEALTDVFYGRNHAYIYKESVFPETYIVLDKLKDRFRFGIFSEGTAKFQNNKFRSMGLNKYFDENLIFIVEAKDTKEVIKKIPKSAVVVDDKESICELLVKNKIKTVWLNKTDSRVNPNFETIHSLLDLSP